MDWIIKEHKQSLEEVSISINKDSKDSETYYTSFRFRRDSWKKVTSTSYIIFAYSNNRIYFKSADRINGFKLCESNQKTPCKYFKARTATKKDFIGDYNLLYDTKEKLYYIDLNKKLDV